MKAEHRKELQTNLLADRLGKLVQNMKSGPSQPALIAGGVVVLVIAVIVAWVLISRNASKTKAQQWVAIDNATTLEDLDKIIQENPGSLPARDARFLKARKLMQEGQAHLYTRDFDFSPTLTSRANLPMGRKEALQSIEEAGQLYQKLAEDCKDSPVLTQEALMGRATSCLIRGEYQDALAVYRECAKRYPKSAQGEKAAKMADELEKNPAGIKEFQNRLADLARNPAGS